jgi:hypothetical protein
MVRIGALFLGLIFSGGAILAAGTVFGPVKRSISGPPADRSPRRTTPKSDGGRMRAGSTRAHRRMGDVAQLPGAT